MCHARGESVRALLSFRSRELWIWDGDVNATACERPGLYEPRSSSAVRESRFTAADREEREAERFAVADAAFCLAPFIGKGGVVETEWPPSTCSLGRDRYVAN